MSSSSIVLKNYARGSGSFHQHRRQIVRSILDGQGRPESLSPFLRQALFRLRAETWSVFKFGRKDWDLCDRLLGLERSEVDASLLALVTEYVLSNLDAVQRLLTISHGMSARLLRSQVLEEGPDALSALDAQSLFGLRLQCAGNQHSTESMHKQLQTILGPGWARSRLSYPLMYHFAAHPPAGQLDSFLSYVLTGEERRSERLALKLMLDDDAGLDLPLAFKLYLGLMGHPYDALELALNHFEQWVATDRPVDLSLRHFVDRMAAVLPGSRAERLASFVTGNTPTSERVDPLVLQRGFGLDAADAAKYAAIVQADPAEVVIENATRPIDVLCNMRASQYPSPREFQYVTADAAAWAFIDGGRLITALLRSMYMIDRVQKDIEARDALRLILAFGAVTPLIASVPSGMLLVRRLAAMGFGLEQTPDKIELDTDIVIRSLPVRDDRVWINLLQWDLRRLEESGRTEQWLRHVRSETKLRPSYLTGINWHWVEEIIDLHRLRPFRSFDGAYLFIHMELERQSDPLRLRLILDPLLRELSFGDAVNRIVAEFGTAAPAIVRRYLTTQNMLASGQAPNYVAALDQRVRALEVCIKAYNFGPLLTEEVYEGEVRTLTAELLLTDVNAGKFEVPWATFRKDANSSHEDLLLAVDSLRARSDRDAAMTELTETPISFPNGASERYKVRQRDRALFSLVIDLIKAYLQHPAFGLEVILSGRFRHNNLLQELWSAMAETNAATIPGVSGFAQDELIGGYRDAAETFVDQWCSVHMQTRRPDKPQALFNLVPTQREMDALLERAAHEPVTTGVVDVVIAWIQDTLRTQVAAAQESFCTTFRQELAATFGLVRDTQAEALAASRAAETSFRPQDITKVHGAVNDAVMRRVDTLAGWFDGVDSEPTETISLADLSVAVEALFENMLNGKSLKADVDEQARQVLFKPDDVKIAFDLLREVYFNALRHGRGGEVRLTVQRSGADSAATAVPLAYLFTNKAEQTDDIGQQLFQGNRYSAATDAVLREGNSGRAKIAASAATLIGRDTTVLCVRNADTYTLEVPLRPEATEARA